MSNFETAARVVSIVGFQDSGKTTLVEQMVRVFSDGGFTVGVIKHDGHAEVNSNEWEKPESDSRRAAAAGATYTMVTGGGESLLRTVRDPFHADPFALTRRLLSQAAADGQPLDVVIIEGFKRARLPKLIVPREPAEPSWPELVDLPNIQGVVCSSPLNLLDGVIWQVYDKTDVTKLCRHVLNHPIFVFDRTFE